MIDFGFKQFHFNFKRPSGTSRGVLTAKTSWFLTAQSEAMHFPALGECSIIEGLSPEPIKLMEDRLTEVCRWLSGKQTKPDLSQFPSIEFGLETLLADIDAQGSKIFSRNDFTAGNRGLLINGLIWMGDEPYIKSQVRDKIEKGFTCIKMKVGAADFETECSLLRAIRKEFGSDFQLRLDANGAFEADKALEQLKRLSEFDIHSIEQPIKPHQWDAMAWLCQVSPIPIALDEELIGANGIGQKSAILESIAPQFIILKPSLLGGFASCDEWIDLAESEEIGWWITSALESNVGLNAIAQYTSEKDVVLPQGLGTGGLFTNNFESPLYIRGEQLHFDPNQRWNLNNLL